MEGLLFFAPTARGKPIKVEPFEQGKGNVKHIPYPLDITWGPSFGLPEALREFLQNFIDEVVKCNGNNFSTLVFDTKSVKNQIIVHNNHVIFGKILQEKNCLCFINYGTVIEDEDDLIVIGRSRKGNNSIGRYGEGMKIAISRFVSQDAIVEISTCVKCDGNVEYHRFKFIEKDEKLYLTRSKLTPKVPKKVGSPVHFMLKIKHDITEDMPIFDLYNYLWPYSKRLLNLDNDERVGSIGPFGKRGHLCLPSLCPDHES